jgi:hypothetical protein
MALKSRCDFIFYLHCLLIVTGYYFGFAKKGNGKTARWLKGNCRLAVLPSCPFAIHVTGISLSHLS